MIEKYLGAQSRILGSKTIYSYSHPENLIIFNSHVINANKEEIWHGDLDITLEESKLIDLAKELNTKLYVFYESAFEKEFPLEKAAYNTDGEIRENLKEYYKRIEGKIRYSPDMIYDDKVITKIIKFDPLLLEKGTKNKTPLDLLYDIVLEKLGGVPEGKIFIPGSVHVTNNTYIILEYIFKKWIRKYHPDIHEARLNTSIAMEFLNIGPMTFHSNLHWMSDEVMYLIGESFKDKN